MRLERAAESISRLRATCADKSTETQGPCPLMLEVGEDLSVYYHGAPRVHQRDAQDPTPAQSVAAATAATATSVQFMTAEVVTPYASPSGGAQAAAPRKAATPPLPAGVTDNIIIPLGGPQPFGGAAVQGKRPRRQQAEALPPTHKGEGPGFKWNPLTGMWEAE